MAAAVDDVFRALADPTRRGIVAQLAAGPSSVSALAAPYDMALPSFLQHVRVLETSGVVASTKVGRVRTCELRTEALAAAEGWLATQRDVWEQRADRFVRYVDELQRRQS